MQRQRIIILLMYNFSNITSIYVSQQNGNDGFNGFMPIANSDSICGGPLKTIDKALEMVSEMRTANAAQPVRIVIMGDYYVPYTLTISGNIADVEFESYSESRARIIGGVKLEGWKKDNFNSHECISCDVPFAGEKAFTDLYVNGKRASFTRYPDGEKLLHAVDTEYNDPWAPHNKGSKWFVAHKEELEGIDGIENGIISFYHYWIDEHTPVESYDRNTGKLVMKYRSRDKITAFYSDNGQGGTSDMRYYIENLPQSFKNKGEWYLDKAAKKVYYIPLDGEDENSIEAFAPVVDCIFSIKGAKDTPICNIRFRNIDFMCTDGAYASTNGARAIDENGVEREKFASDSQSVAFGNCALCFENAYECSVENCSISNVGMYAVGILKATHDIRIENTVMENLGAGGVRIFGGAYSEDESARAQYTHHNVVRGCRIAHCGLRYAAGCGILASHASNCEFSENEICYTDYTGISVGWSWGYKKSNTYGNIVRRNHIHHIGMGRLSDMGAIYTLGLQKGTIIDGNVIHDVNSAHYGGWGIYTDEGSSYITIENNIVYRTKSNCYHQHYGSYNVVRNNIFAFSGEALIRVSRNENHFGILFEKNILVSDAQPVYGPSFDSSVAYKAIISHDNIVWDVSGREPVFVKDNGRDIEFDEWHRTTGLDENTVICDPKLADIKGCCFNLQKDSPAVDMGFVPIDHFVK